MATSARPLCCHDLEPAPAVEGGGLTERANLLKGVGRFGVLAHFLGAERAFLDSITSRTTAWSPSSFQTAVSKPQK